MTAARAEGASRAVARALQGLGLAAACAGVFALRGSLNRRFDAARRTLDDANIPRPNVARAASLGHTEWVADVLWVNATLYYGETMYAHLPARYVRSYAETMIELDPHFQRPYVWAAMSLLYRTVRSTQADARDAATFLRRGLRLFPTDPELHMQLGFNLAFEQVPYVPTGSPEFVRLRAEGGEHLAFAASAGVGPLWLPLSASTMLRNGGREREAILVLCDGLVHTSDPETFSRIEARLTEMLRGRVDEDPLFQGIMQTVRSRRRYHPWMPPTLHLFVGEPLFGEAPATP